MRKILVFMSLMAAWTGAWANYTYLEFKTTAGEVKSIDCEGLTIVVDGDNLVVSNKAGESWTVSADNLQSMAFTDTNAGVGSLPMETSGELEVYDTGGVYCGRYAGLEDARKSLNPGVYVFKAADGSTFKIVIGR